MALWKPAERAIAQRLTALGKKATEIQRALKSAGFDRTPHAVELYCHKNRDEWALARAEEAATYDGIEPTILMAILKKRGRLSIDDLSEEFDRSRVTIRHVLELMAADGHAIRLDRDDAQITPPGSEPIHIPTLADEPRGKLTIGVASDIHKGSTAEQGTNLRAFADVAYNRFGVRHMFVPGDVHAGVNVFRGQVYELYAQGAEDQIDAAYHNIPRFDGMKWILMGGNHDTSFYSAAGLLVVKSLCDRRDDLIYMGSDSCDVPLTPDIDVRMWHPSGGVPYALSYRGQRYENQIALEQLMDVIVKGASPKLRIVLIGHLHVSIAMPAMPFLTLQCGCFEGRNSYLKRKGLTPHIGGWIIELEITRSGIIHQVVPRWIEYTEIEDDYKNGYIPNAEPDVADEVGPLFVSLQDVSPSLPEV